MKFMDIEMPVRATVSGPRSNIRVRACIVPDRLRIMTDEEMPVVVRMLDRGEVKQEYRALDGGLSQNVDFRTWQLNAPDGRLWSDLKNEDQHFYGLRNYPFPFVAPVGIRPVKFLSSADGVPELEDAVARARADVARSAIADDAIWVPSLGPRFGIWAVPEEGSAFVGTSGYYRDNWHASLLDVGNVLAALKEEFGDSIRYSRSYSEDPVEIDEETMSASIEISGAEVWDRNDVLAAWDRRTLDRVQRKSRQLADRLSVGFQERVGLIERLLQVEDVAGDADIYRQAGASIALMETMLSEERWPREQTYELRIMKALSQAILRRPSPDMENDLQGFRA